MPKYKKLLLMTGCMVCSMLLFGACGKKHDTSEAQRTGTPIERQFTAPKVENTLDPEQAEDTSALGTDPTAVLLDGKMITLETGDEIQANAWNELDVTRNGKTYSQFPTFYQGITLGSEMRVAVGAYGLKKGYAIVDRQIDKKGDGTTEVVIDDYTDLDFFDRENVLDANLIFGYQKDKDGQWQPVDADTLMKLYQEHSTKAEGIVMYTMDICGNAVKEEAAKSGQVIAMTVRYY